MRQSAIYISVVFLLVAMSTPAGVMRADHGWPVMPDRRDVVRQLAQRYPGEWRDAHRAGVSHERGSAFIRRLAWELHRRDKRFGLNGKCNTTQISFDVIAWKNPAVPGFNVEAADVIAGAGGPDPQPTWFNITDPNGCGSKWIAPTPVARR